MADAFALELSNISKRFGTHWALAHLNYGLPPARSLLLTGHNGSGKTTLLRLLATAIQPTLGQLQVLGFSAKRETSLIRQHTALLSHASYHYEDLSAEQNLKLLARLLGKPSAQLPLLLERVGLSSRKQSPVRQFSAGMRKRLAIARLLLKAPRLALLDEPFGELDPSGIVDMENLIRELKAQGTTLILATHLVEQGLSLTESRLHLNQGRIEEAS
ncbi:MAG: ABC transporter ATP-binding protein [Cystobacterineae bacterium]|nr:ABC transporter ATP-binding protein [Cystobacterineae bacterium]